MVMRRQQGAWLGRRLLGRRHFLGLAAAVAGGALLAACGSAGTGGAATATMAPTAPTSAAVAASSPAAAATVAKVNANTATRAELLQAFQAAGIPNADRWVREVMEYRPYPTDDPTFAKLRGELAKYNPGPGVVDQIIAVLSL